jgi:hypothetical protein
VEHAVDTSHCSRGQRAIVPATGPQEMGVEVVDVRSRQLGETEVAEVRLEMTLDD